MKKSACGFRGGPSDGRRNSFTLIELLVVIAIIAILAAMLLPALKGAKDTANKAVCTSNMKGVSMAINFYADDNGDYLPPIVTDQVGWSDYWDKTRIWQMLYSTANSDDSTWPKSVFFCPVTGNTIKTGASSHYAMNGWFGDGTTTNHFIGHRRSLGTDPSKTLLIGEGSNHFIDSWFWTVPPGQPPLFPHSRRMNIYYMDLHQDSLTFNELQIVGPSSTSILWKGR